MESNIVQQIKVNLLEYFSSIDFDAVLKRQIKSFLAQYYRNVFVFNTHKSFYCPIYMDLETLSKISSLTANILITNPLFVQDICRHLIFMLLSFNDDMKNILKTCFNVTYINAKIVIVNQTLPLGNDYFHHLCTLKGVVTEYSFYMRECIRSTCWICNICNPVVVAPLVGMPEVIPICSICKNPMSEILNERVIGTRNEGQIVHKYLRRSLHGQLMNWMNFSAEDDCAQHPLVLGGDYAVTGLWKGTVFDVWGFQLLGSRSQISTANRVKTLCFATQNHPGLFVKILTHYCCSLLKINGLENQHFHIFIGLLLSIVSTTTFKPLPISVVVDNVALVADLMLSALLLTNRSVHFRYPFSRFGVFYKWQTQQIYGGALTLARHGVCFLGDVGIYPEDVMQDISTALDQGVIPIHGIEGATVPMECALWTINTPKQAENCESLLNYFGFPWRENTSLANGGHYFLGDHFENWEITKQVQFSIEEIKEYINSVMSNEVHLTEEVAGLLDKYITCLKKIKGSGYIEQIVNFQNYLNGLTAAHARLNGRNETTTIDALVVIQLCEIGSANTLIPFPIHDFAIWLENDLFSVLND